MNIQGKTIQILKYTDTLRKNDICRLIVQTGDEGGFNGTYKPENWNPLEWQPVKSEMSGWINKPIDGFSYHVWYEYARFV